MKSFWAIALLALPLMFVSCDDDPWYDDWEPWWGDNYDWGGDYRKDYTDHSSGDDRDEDFFVAMAQTLAGQWRGDLMAYELDSAGNAIDSIYYSTDIEFKQYNNNSISGTGTQYDFEITTDANGRQQMATDPFTRDFSWYIDTSDGTIYLNYKGTNADGSTSNYLMSIAYDDLNLDNRTFTGYLWSADGGEVDDFWFNRYTEESNAKGAHPTTAGKPVTRIKLVMK